MNNIKFNAVTLVKIGSEVLGGNGGGRPEMAMGGGPLVENADAALEAIRTFIKNSEQERLK